MSAKVIVPGALILVWLGGLAPAADPIVTPYGIRDVDAQNPGATPVQPPPPNPAAPGVIQVTPPTPSAVPFTPAAPPSAPAADSPIPAVTHPEASLPAGSVCSPWSGPGGTGCCGPVGKNGPIATEGYLRTGIAIPVAGGIFNNTLNRGWIISGGSRSLFFNPAGSAAWTLEYGLDYIYNNGNHPELEFDMFGEFFNIKEYHRAALHLAAGREWFIYTPAYKPGTNWRFGTDVGGRYGFSRVNLNVTSEDPLAAPLFDKKSDVFGGVFIGLHTDFEFPLSDCTTFLAGFRAEWSYTFTDIIPTWDVDLQEVIFMLNFGIRF